MTPFYVTISNEEWCTKKVNEKKFCIFTKKKPKNKDPANECAKFVIVMFVNHRIEKF